MSDQALATDPPALPRGAVLPGEDPLIGSCVVELVPSPPPKGPISTEQVLRDLDVIKQADLGTWDTLTAQLLLLFRNFVINQGGSLKPIEVWTIEDVIRAAERIR